MGEPVTIEDPDGEQHDPAARNARPQTTSFRSVRAGIRRVAGCATSTRFAGHASETADAETQHLYQDHSMSPQRTILIFHEKSAV
jgi:hypothetical protein